MAPCDDCTGTGGIEIRDRKRPQHMLPRASEP